MTDPRPAPYPAKTKAGGWKFELDPDKINQSDTWALAGARTGARAWLVLLWFTAWQQIPCGSLPNDDELIAAHLGMPPEQFAAMRSVLLRNWWLADDGRLYLDTIVAQVQSMLGKKKTERERKATWRAQQAAAAASDAGPGHVPRDSDGTGDGQDERGAEGGELRDGDAGPGAGPQQSAPNDYGSMARAIRKAGIVSVSSGNPTFRTLVDAGVSFDEFNAFIPAAKDKDSPFNYLVAAVAKARVRAADTGSKMHRGPMPGAAAPPSADFMNRARAAAGLQPVAPETDTIEMPA